MLILPEFIISGLRLFQSRVVDGKKDILVISNRQYDSSELGEELCPVSTSLPLRAHKVYIRVSFSDTFLRWMLPFVTNSCHY